MDNYKIVVKTFSGLETVLFKEIISLFDGKAEKLNRGVLFYGTLEDVYRANLMLRTAVKVLVQIAEFDVKDKTELYNNAKKIDWGRYFTVYQSFAIDGIGQSKYFNSLQYVSLVIKDAVADRFREKYSRRPNVAKNSPEIPIVAHLQDEKVSIYLNASGESLFKRGYRQSSVEAPLNEVLAAGILQLSEWDGKQVLIDPMCGSGTIPIEAAFLATGIPPNFQRNAFAFMNWRNFEKNLWLSARDSVKLVTDIPRKPYVFGHDIKAYAIENAKENLLLSGVQRIINFSEHDFFSFIPPAENGVLIFNPPYNKRLKLDDNKLFYKSIGDHLKKHFVGYDVWIYSADESGIKFLGLHPDKKIALDNAKIKAKLYHYPVYEGNDAN
ncbi:MAG: hypothetical protein J7L46_03190 [Bacteroidales bacterium]|nr:hypothetical protein [Bacteroidales bacterium]